MRSLQAGGPVCLTLTTLDALVVARSAFESSFHYRSAVMFGRCSPLAGPDKIKGLELLTERILPGRTHEVRTSTRREISATTVLDLTLEDWSFKSSHNWPDDPPSDVAATAWAGIVPYGSSFGLPCPAPNLSPGIPVPNSVLRLIELSNDE